MIKKTTTILFLCLLGVLSGQGQERNTPADRYLENQIEQHQLDRDRWSELTRDINYTEKQRKPESSPQPDNRQNGRQDRSILGEGAGAALARFFLIALGAIAIALLVRSILGYGRVKNKKITRKTEEQIDIQKIEENIHEADLVNYIGQAKAAGNYNLAIRLYYLAILKELSLQKTIKWKVDKTNYEYLAEMRGHQLFSGFRDLTRIFERCWYGDRTLDRAAFDRLEPGFQQFTNQLASAKTPQAS